MISKDKQIEVKANAKDIKGLADLLVDFGRTYDDSIQGLEDLLIEAIITAGYRKASEVAREIIKYLAKLVDDKEILMCFGGQSSWFIKVDDVTDLIAELNKKYT